MRSHDPGVFDALVAEAQKNPLFLKETDLDRYKLNEAQIQKLYITAVKADADAFYEIPGPKLTKDICLVAIESPKVTLDSIPKPLLDDEIYLKAITKNYLDVTYVPPEKFSKPLYIERIKEIALKNVMILRIIAEKMPKEIYLPLCLEVVQKNGLALNGVPENLRDYELSLNAVIQNHAALPFVKSQNMDLDEYLTVLDKILEKDVYLFKIIRPQYFPSSDIYHNLAINFVHNVPLGLACVDVNHRHMRVCLTAVKRNGLALEFVDPERFTESDYRELCIQAIQKNPLAIQFVESLDLKLALKAVILDGLALEFIDPEQFTDEEYRQICIAAIKENPFAIAFVHPEKLDRDVILDAVDSDGKVLELIPKERRDYEVCLTAVKDDVFALAHVPPDVATYDLLHYCVKKNGLTLQHIKPIDLPWLTPEQYKMLCMVAVKQCSKAFQFIQDESLKKSIIEEVGVEELIADDYECRHYISDEYKSRIDLLLSRVKHIVVTENSELIDDPELHDAFLVYSHADARKNLAIHTDKEYLETLLKDISALSNEKLNLVLLGHATDQDDDIADFTVPEIIDTLKKNRNISRVTLLGCNSAKSLPLTQEINMIQDFITQEQAKIKFNQEHGVGLVLMSKKPDEKEQKKILNKLRKDKNGMPIDRVYIIVEEKKGDLLEHNLMYLERNGDQAISELSLLDKDGLISLQNKFTRGRNFNFPQGDNIVYLRGKGTDKLSLDDCECIMEIVHGSIFDRNHPAYEEIKKLYPFLSNMKIDASEQDKLLDSLLKLIVEAIQQDPDITWNITVKGYCNPVHVDTEEQRMHITRTHLYLPEYKIALFFERGKNINTSKLEGERHQTIGIMRQGGDQQATIAKSISFTVEKDTNDGDSNNNNNNNNNHQP